MLNFTSLMIASTGLIGGGSLLWFLYRRKLTRSGDEKVTTTKFRQSLTKGIRRSFGEPKMVFVINKPLFGGKTGIANQQLYQLIASCCIGKSDQDLMDIPKHADKIGLKSLILYENDWPTEETSDTTGRPLIVCLLGPAKKLACTAFSALLKSMQESKVFALVRYAHNVRSSPKVGALIPEVDSKRLEYLVFVTLPFSDDCRFYPFASLNQEILRPKDEQVEAMDAFLDGLNLNRGNLSEHAFNPLEAVNPHVQYVFQCLKHRQMYPNDPLPQPGAEVLSFTSPNDQLFDSLKPIINNLKSCFKLEKVQKLGKRAGANVFSTTDDQARSEKMIESDKKEKTEVSVKISTVKPVEDFTDITETNPELFEEAANQLGDIIGQFIFESMGSQLHLKALECVTCFRNACIKVSKPGYYNRFILTFKTSLLSKNKIVFWNKLCESGQGLICDNECSSSQVSDREANEFLQKEETKIADDKPTEEPEPSQDDLLNELE
uniref:Uncharacterized protein n=1 Tax=Romanomermis culicivorax TaxID=13658 RepID=A0A915KN11_ROMCU